MTSLKFAMEYFVAVVRRVDAWQKKKSLQSNHLYETQCDANIGFLKDPIAQSADPLELIEFINDTQADIHFMIQMPSIVMILKTWWQAYSDDANTISVAQFRVVFRDLAFAIVDAKSIAMLRGYVADIMRSPEMDWGSSEMEIDQAAFNAALFNLAHLMVETTQIGDYMTYLKQVYDKLQIVKKDRDSTAPGFTRPTTSTPSKAQVEKQSSRAESPTIKPKHFIPTGSHASNIPGKCMIPQTAVILRSKKVHVSKNLIVPCYEPSNTIPNHMAGPMHIARVYKK